MNQKLVIFLIVSMGITSTAQTINLHGKVTNKNGNPVSGAIVTLTGKKMSDTTDATGQYSIQGSTTAFKPNPVIPSSEKISMKNGQLILSLVQAVPVKVEFFDVKGNVLEKFIKQNVSAGEYRFMLTKNRMARNVMAIRVSIGNRSSTFRYIPVHDSRNFVNASSCKIVSTENQGELLKLEAVVDSLNVTAKNYITSSVTVNSYTAELNITLDSITLARFSFFVTSQKVLQELSGSVNGFGGDLRFGKTGPGAGLRGADSICSCIAEKSMPGSKVKVWRAFLSVSKDENGKQVNAVDRIGNGPWYDRTGRLLAPTLKDLINTRPLNGDATIKNDLPNEDGIPNHYPIGTTAVDNHHMITGSNSSGKLYSATSTCDDWTSTTYTTGKPMCGFAWPRSTTGTYSWIYGFSANGCAAGYETVDNGGGVRGTTIIGSGGGYGGFYCFALNP